MRLSAFLRHPRTAVLARWGRVPGLRTAKATLAAVLSYVAADLLNTTDAPILAPLTALLVVQLTVYETVAQGIQRILSVLAGVLVAVGIATFVGLSWWSLGAVVAVSLVVGQLLRLGPHTVEVPISAMLVLAVGGAGAEGAAAGRVYETLDRRRDRPRGQLRRRPAGERAAGRRRYRTAGRPAGGVPARAGRGAAHGLVAGGGGPLAQRGAGVGAARFPGGPVPRPRRTERAAQSARRRGPRGPAAAAQRADRARALLRPAADAVPGDFRPHVVPAAGQGDRGVRPGGSRRPRRRARMRRRGDERRGRDRRAAPSRSRRPAPGCRSTWSNSIADATGWANCCWSTRTPTRRPGSSTVRCWPPSTGCGWRSRRRYVRRPSPGAHRSSPKDRGRPCGASSTPPRRTRCHSSPNGRGRPSAG